MAESGLEYLFTSNPATQTRLSYSLIKHRAASSIYKGRLLQVLRSVYGF